MPALLIVQRELSAFVRSPSAYLIVGLVLLVDGLLFNAFALGASPKPSAQVLEDFFQLSSGTTMVASVLVAMRSLSEERSAGTLVLLTGSPARSVDIVLGKFASAYALVLVLIALTAFMPALIVVHGRVSLGHVFSGYMGLALLAAVSTALGVLGSAWGRTQLLSGTIGAALLVTLLLSWLLARLSEPPVSDVLRYLALWETHFLPFQRGVVRLSGIVYMVSVAVLALALACSSLDGERWQ